MPALNFSAQLAELVESELKRARAICEACPHGDDHFLAACPTCVAFALAQDRAELDTLRLVEGMDAVIASALFTFLRGGDIPETIDRARAVLVNRLLRAEQKAAQHAEALQAQAVCNMDTINAMGRLRADWDAEREELHAKIARLEASIGVGPRR